MKVRENLESRGLLLAIRIAPDERDSSPGYLTMVRQRLRSFGKSRIAFEKPSCVKEVG
jgi:hypothetical protein